MMFTGSAYFVAMGLAVSLIMNIFLIRKFLQEHKASKVARRRLDLTQEFIARRKSAAFVRQLSSSNKATETTRFNVDQSRGSDSLHTAGKASCRRQKSPLTASESLKQLINQPTVTQVG
eukprot:CFRG3396T1